MGRLGGGEAKALPGRLSAREGALIGGSVLSAPMAAV